MFLPAVRTYLPSSSHPVSLSTLAEYTPRGHQNCRQSGGGGSQVYCRGYTVGWRQKFGLITEKTVCSCQPPNKYLPSSLHPVSLGTMPEYTPRDHQNCRQSGGGGSQVYCRGYTVGWRQKFGFVPEKLYVLASRPTRIPRPLCIPSPAVHWRITSP